MTYKLDADSQKLLRSVGDEVLIGVVGESSRLISLYRAGKRASPRDRVFPGHRQLLDAGEVEEIGFRGFSMHVKGGKLVTFYRNSILNLHRPEFCVSLTEMKGIIEAMELQKADDFAAYP
jgi:hypothetical protein